MPLRAISPGDPLNPGPCDVIDICPICEGRMEAVYSRAHQKVCVCIDCHTSVTVPATAWQIRNQKPR